MIPLTHQAAVVCHLGWPLGVFEFRAENWPVRPAVPCFRWLVSGRRWAGAGDCPSGGLNME